MRNIKNGLIMKITGFIAISFSIVCSTAACSDDPVAVANPEPAVTVVKVPTEVLKKTLPKQLLLKAGQ